MSTPLLHTGSIGPDVKKLQETLGIDGDGVFGPKTHAAVAKFQREHRLVPDGSVGPETERALALKASADAYHAPDVPPQPAPSDPVIVSGQPTPAAPAVTPVQPTPTAPLHGRRQPAHRSPTPAPQAATPPSPAVAATMKRILDTARAEVGQHEVGGDNRGPAMAKYGAPAGEPWCAFFETWTVGQVMPGMIHPTGSAKNLMQQVHTQGAFHPVASNYRPKQGDMLFFDNGPGRGHVGFVERVDRNGTVHTIEGNIPPQGPVAPAAAQRDGVYRTSYSPASLREWQLLGYGDTQTMVATQLGQLGSPQVAAAKPANQAPAKS